LPPYLRSVMTGRRNFCQPVPHSAEHVPSLTKLPTTQSIGHGSVPHDCVCLVSESGQSAAVPLTMRVRVCSPPPHSLVHLDHSPQLPIEHVGVGGHAWVSQS
jgi:hypothetical protein